MANVVQGTSNGEYDLARSLRLYDTSGDLPERARELWQLIGGDAKELAREFWRRYAMSPEVRETVRRAPDRAAGRQDRPLHRQQVRASRPSAVDRAGAGLCRQGAWRRPDACRPCWPAQCRNRGRLCRPARQVERRGRSGPPRPHPVGDPGDRDRLLHPSRHHHHPARERAGPVAPGRQPSTAG